MKYTLPVLAVCAGAVSGSFMERRMPAILIGRDAATVTAAFADITAKTGTLDTAVQAYSKGANFQPLKSASDAVLASIKAGDAAVAASTPLSVDEATGIANGVLGLNSTVAILVDRLIGKKDDFVADGHAGEIYQSLVDQKAAATSFSATVTGKTPDLVKPVADELSKGITASLDRGIAAFQGLGPPPSSSTPSSPSSSPASPPGSSSGSGSPPSSSLPLPPPGSSSPSKPTGPSEPIPGEPCPTEPGATHPAPPASPAPPKPTKPAKPSTPAKPAVPETPSAAIPPPALYTSPATRVGASIFALGVAAIGLVL